MKLDLLRESLAFRRAEFKSLSKRTGVPEQRLSEIAEGSEPKLPEWRALKKALRLVASNGSESQRYDFLFRSPVGGKQLSPELLAQLSSKMKLSDELQPKSSVTLLSLARNAFLPGESLLDAEANAVIFRKLFATDNQLRPLTDLPHIVGEKLSIRLFLVDTPGIEGASVWTHNDAFIFLARRFQPRMLFTLAHEVAHLLFHHSGQEEFVKVDFEPVSGFERPSNKSPKAELYAHAFASALLMPDAAVGAFLKAIRDHRGITGALGDVEINWMSRFFGVSFFAAAMRCETLKLLPRGGAVSLDDAVKKEFGSAEKRAQAIGLPERALVNFQFFPPDLMRAAIEKVRNGSMSIGRASSELGVTIADLISANEQMVH